MGDLPNCEKLVISALLLLLTALDSCAGYCTQGSEWIEYNDHCYYWERFSPVNWFRAELNCKQAGGHLVSVPTEDENKFLHKLTQCRNTFWTGMVNTVPSLRSSQRGGFEWWDGATQNYTNLVARNEIYLDCVYFNRDGKWYNYPCQYLFSYVCKARAATQGNLDEKPTPAELRNNGTTDVLPTPTNATVECPDGWQQVEKSCYFVSVSDTNYFNAQMSCQAMGGNVASILTPRESGLLAVALGCLPAVWIGLEKARPCFKQPSQHYCWVWMDRSPVNYLDWRPGQNLDQQDYECVILDGQWVTTNCYKTYRYICKKPL